MPGPWNLPVAQSVPFDNSTNGFIAENVQEAIEESLSDSVGTIRYAITTFHNGVIGNNQWLGPSELGPNVNIPIAINSVLSEIAFSFDALSVDGTFQLFIGDRVTVDASLVFTNVDNIKIWTGINLPINAGQFFVGRWIDSGSNPSDMAIIYHFKVVL